MTLREMMELAVHNMIDSDNDNDFHVSREIVRRVLPRTDAIYIEEVSLTRIPIRIHNERIII